MHEVTLLHLSTNDISDILKQMRDAGFYVGKDFEFLFSPSSYDYHNLEVVPRSTRFSFYNQSIATWFALKYQ